MWVERGTTSSQRPLSGNHVAIAQMHSLTQRAYTFVPVDCDTSIVHANDLVYN